MAYGRNESSGVGCMITVYLVMLLFSLAAWAAWVWFATKIVKAAWGA